MTPRRVELRRLAAAGRAVIEHLVSTAATVDELAAAADELEDVATVLCGDAGGPGLRRASPRWPTPVGPSAAADDGDDLCRRSGALTPRSTTARSSGWPTRCRRRSYFDYERHRVTGTVNFGVGVRGPARLRARRLRGGGVRRAARCGAVAVGHPGHDGSTRRELPVADAARTGAATSRACCRGTRAARSSARAGCGRATACAPRPRACSSRSTPSGSRQLLGGPSGSGSVSSSAARASRRSRAAASPKRCAFTAPMPLTRSSAAGDAGRAVAPPRSGWRR